MGFLQDIINDSRTVITCQGEVSALLPQPVGLQAGPIAADPLASQQIRPAVNTGPAQINSSTTINHLQTTVIEPQTPRPSQADIVQTDTSLPHFEPTARSQPAVPVEPDTQPVSRKAVSVATKPGIKVQRTTEQVPFTPQATIPEAAAQMTPRQHPNHFTKTGAPPDNIAPVTAAHEHVADARVDSSVEAITTILPQTPQIPVATQKSRPLREADTSPSSSMPQPDQRINEAVVNRTTQQSNPYTDKTGATLKREQHSGPHQVRIGQVNLIVQTPADPVQPKKARREEREQRGWNRLRSL